MWEGLPNLEALVNEENTRESMRDESSKDTAALDLLENRCSHYPEALPHCGRGT